MGFVVNKVQIPTLFSLAIIIAQTAQYHPTVDASYFDIDSLVEQKPYSTMPVTGRGGLQGCEMSRMQR
jgi:hypothetical protein